MIQQGPYTFIGGLCGHDGLIQLYDELKSDYISRHPDEHPETYALTRYIKRDFNAIVQDLLFTIDHHSTWENPTC